MNICTSFVRGVLGTALFLGCGAAVAGDLWLAVGYGGRRMISTDGKTWEVVAEWAQPGGDDGNNLISAVYAQGKFVVVGGGGAGATGAGHILVSRDGREWKETHKDKSRISPVAYGGGRFVVGATHYPSGKLMWSSDGETWTPGAAIPTPGLTHFRNGAYGNGRFVLVGNGQIKGEDGKPKPIHWAVTSENGEKIDSVRTDLAAHGDLWFGGGRFVMLSHEGVLQSSEDGAEWTVHPFEPAERPRWLLWDGTKFLAGDGKTGWESADGKTWKKGTVTSHSSVEWSDGKRYIATGWPGRMFYSADGKTWEKSPVLPDNGINVVVHGETPKE